MNPEKLKKLQAQVAQVRIGGKGTPRRKKKIVHQTTATDDKKLQSTLKKLAVNNIPGIEEVNMIKSDGTVIHFNNPRTQASLPSNTFAITGHAETKNIAEIWEQLGGGADGVQNLKRLVSSMGASMAKSNLGGENEDDIPDLIKNFDLEGGIEKNIDEAIKAAAQSETQSAPTEVVD